MRHRTGMVTIVASVLLAFPLAAQHRGGGFGGGRGGSGHVGGGGFSHGGGGIRGGGAAVGGGGGVRFGGGGARIGGGYGVGRGGYGSGSRVYYGRGGGYYSGFGYGPSWYRFPGYRSSFFVRGYRSYPYFYSWFGLPAYYYYDWYVAPSLTAYYPSYVSYPPYSEPPVYYQPSEYAPNPPYSSGRIEYGGRDQFGQARDTSGEPVRYAIAFQDGSTESCVAYWVEGKTLHYVMRDHAMRQSPLDTVDRARSEQLNREQHVEFRLPRAQ